MKFKWNRTHTILVLFMFITVTFASFNTNLFIDGKAYVRADELVRITNIELVESTNSAYETYDPEYSKDTITINSNLPKQDSTSQYRITITNNSDYDYDVQDIIEQTYSNNKISYNITGLTVDDTVLEAHTTSTFLLTLSNNTTITEEPDVYQTLTYTFDYTGGEQEFVVPYDGDYTLEVWGAQGGSSTSKGGYGAYSKGTIHLNKNSTIYINVGGTTNNSMGGYNGGGSSKLGDAYGGGGATHISSIKGELSALNRYKGQLSNDGTYYISSHIFIVAGGGGGVTRVQTNYGGAGGGKKSNAGIPDTCVNDEVTCGGYSATQTSAGTCRGENSWCESGIFGHGGNSTWREGSNYISTSSSGGGGGGGFYGGGSGVGGGCYGSGAGGSGYIANSHLNNKVMYCYNCEESNDTETKTISTNNHSSSPVSEYAKEGNGYAKITLTRKIEDSSEYDFDYTGGEQSFTTPYTGIYKLETWGAQGGSINYNNSYYLGGYGGYSTGKINLNKNETFYINVGGSGEGAKDILEYPSGGYNGGGSVVYFGGDTKEATKNRYTAGGGGATHIATVSGTLSSLENRKQNIVMVSGGGGGGYKHQATSSDFAGTGGSGGGYKGNDGEARVSNNYFGLGGNQTAFGCSKSYNDSCGGFGFGGNVESDRHGSAGGSGYYGGGACKGTSGESNGSGGGGSGYIGYSELYDKKMYCYNCSTSNDDATRTISTLSHSKDPKKNISKEGNGYSRITLVKRLSNNIELSLKFDIQRLTDYEITYDLDGGTISGQKSSYTRNTNTFTLPTPIKDGYTFVGWIGGKNIYNEDTTNENNRYWSIDYPGTIRTDTVNKFTYQEFTPGEIKTYSISFDEEVLAPGTTTRAYYRFVQFDSNGDFLAINPRSNTKNNQQYTLNEDTASFVLQVDKGPNAYFSNLQIELGDEITAYEPYISTPQSITIQKSSRGNRTYKAIWEPIDYNIEYDLDGGTLSSQVTTYNAETNTFTLPTPTKEGYEFLGWTGGKNLLEMRNESTTFNGLTFTVNQNKTLTINGKSTKVIYYNLNAPGYYNQGEFESQRNIPLKANTTYYFNGQTFGNGYLIECNLSGDNGNLWPKTGFTTESKDTKAACYMYIGSNTVFNNVTIEPQLEKGNKFTGYEQYISTPTSVTITKGSAGNRIYHANWKAIDYDIEYDLNDGTIENEPTTYNISTNNITLPTPTKEGYFFAGWTGGKNLYNPNGHVLETSYGINNTINEDGSITSIGNATKTERWTVLSSSYSINKYLTIGEQYTISQKDSQNKINPTTYLQINDLAKNSEDTNKYYYITNSNVTFTADDNYNHNIVVQTAKYGGAEVNITNYFQLEKGSKATEYEKYINVPQENLVIDSGSQGHRFYTANWETRGIGDYNILSGWVDGDTGEVLSGDPHDRYPDPYYTKIMKLTGGKTYTVQGGISGSDVRWRRYDLNGKYTTYVQGESFTPQSDCYVRVLLIQNVTESVKQNFSITETQ